VTVDDFVALQEVGRVLHPVLARGQITGGVAQGIGFALYEKVVWRNGRMQNGQMTNYIMPTSADLPPIRVYFEELGNVQGAFGAKGIGELPMDGPAPAIVNAMEDALGVRFDSIPLLPEDIFEVMTARSRARRIPARKTGFDEPSSRPASGHIDRQRPETERARLPDGKIAGRVASADGIDGNQRGLRRRRVRVVFGADGWCAGQQLPGADPAGAGSGNHYHRRARPGSAAARIAGSISAMRGAQCGICTPGMILAACHLLNGNPQPTLEDIREGLSEISAGVLATRKS